MKDGRVIRVMYMVVCLILLVHRDVTLKLP